MAPKFQDGGHNGEKYFDRKQIRFFLLQIAPDKSMPLFVALMTEMLQHLKQSYLGLFRFVNTHIYS